MDALRLLLSRALIHALRGAIQQRDQPPSHHLLHFSFFFGTPGREGTQLHVLDEGGDRSPVDERVDPCVGGVVRGSHHVVRLRGKHAHRPGGVQCQVRVLSAAQHHRAHDRLGEGALISQRVDDARAEMVARLGLSLLAPLLPPHPQQVQQRVQPSLHPLLLERRPPLSLGRDPPRPLPHLLQRAFHRHRSLLASSQGGS